jgi:DNA-directed RNA polymerase specialized sigma24 family protein
MDTTPAREPRAKMLASLRAQNPAVARPLWHWFAPPVHRLLRRTLGPRAAIDDAVQVVLLCVFRRGPSLRPNADLRKFVLRTTARIALGELRGQASRRRAPSPAPADPERGHVDRFYRILDGLRPRDRIAFIFHHIEGLELGEVAGALGDAPARTRRRVHRSVANVIEGIERDPLLASLQRSGRA